ncbi:MAG: hypothetical protein E6Q76_18655 [Rhizobium sp.]|nr:MAG: hypothetical protein E6Q76_18655 [Rhizobium sp.]
MIVDDVKARLDISGTPFALVKGANELADVLDRPPATPAAYVFISGENSAENERINGPLLQRTSADVSVVIITENSGTPDDVARDIEQLKKFVRKRLLGFTPTEADPLEHIVGKIQQVKDGMVWFEDVFGTAFYMEEEL